MSRVPILPLSVYWYAAISHSFPAVRRSVIEGSDGAGEGRPSGMPSGGAMRPTFEPVEESSGGPTFGPIEESSGNPLLAIGALSALAAKNVGGSTLHRLFKLPVVKTKKREDAAR